MKQKKYTISVLGTQNPIGQALLAELDRQNYPPLQIRLLDLHQEAGASFSYRGQTLVSSALDLFDLTQPHILFLCEPKIFDRYPHHFLHGKNWLIDCTGRIAKASCIIPELNAKQSKYFRRKCLCAPHSAVIALAQALVPLDRFYHLIHINSVAIMGSWYYQIQTPNDLITQTRHFFTQTPTKQIAYNPIFAFNLIPNLFKESVPIITRQMKCFISAPFEIATCFAPVIRGAAFYVQATFNKQPQLNKMLQLYEDIGVCHLVLDEKDISTHDILTEDKIFIEGLHFHHNTLSFWVIQDFLQTGAIQNAVRILGLLTK